MQRNLARRNENRTSFEISALDNLRFARFDILYRYPYMPKKPLPLGRKFHSAVAPYKKRTTEFAFERFYGAGQIGLIVQKNSRRLRDVAIFRHIIKYSVIIVSYVHFTRPLSFDFDMTAI